MGERRRRRVPPVTGALLVLLVGILVVLGPALVGGKVLSNADVQFAAPPYAADPPAGYEGPSNIDLNDATYVFHPELQQVRQALRDGRLPLWNDALGAGRPLLAAQQTAPLHPLTWLTAALPFWDALAWVAALKILVAGLGTWLLCRGLGLRPAAAALGGAAFALGTLFIAWLEHPHTYVYGLLPWALWAVDRLAARRGWPDAALLGGVVGLQALGGHPETFAVSLALTGAYALFRLRRSRAGLLRAAGAGVIGLGLGLVMILPLAEMALQALRFDRGAVPPDTVTVFGLALPEFWGRIDKTGFAEPNGGWAGQALYVGAVPLLLAAVAVVRGTATARFFALVAVVGVVIAVDNPVAALAREVPVLGKGNLGYLIWLTVFALAVLGAIGLDRLLARDVVWDRRLLGAVAAVCVVPLFAVATETSAVKAAFDGLEQLPVLRDDVATPGAAAAGALWRWAVMAALAVALGLAAWRRPPLAGALAVAAVALTTADLASLDRGYHQLVDQAVAAPPDPPALTALRRAAGDGRMAADGEALGPNLAAGLDLRDARGQDLPALRRYSQLWFDQGGERGAIGDHRTLLDLQDPRERKLLDLFGVRAVLDAGTTPVPDGLEVLFDGPSGRVLRNPTAFPPAWFTTAATPVGSRGAARSAVSGRASADLLRAPVVEGDLPAGDRLAARAGRVSPARVRRVDDEHVEVTVDAPAAGVVVLGDTHYPGWKASVDGEDAEILAANLSFRAVRVAEGRHTIAFRYEPATVRAGAAGSLIALVLVAAGGAGGLLRRRRRAPAG